MADKWNRLGLYILDGHEPVEEPDVLKWGRWFETANRHVADTTKGHVRVSTVFLGLNHAFLADQPPLFFETMVFGGKYNGDQDRYSTWEEAEKGHRRICRFVFKNEKGKGEN